MALQPSWLNDHYTPRVTDPRWRVRAKILGVIQSRGGAMATNNPLPHDTRWVLRRKINRALA